MLTGFQINALAKLTPLLTTIGVVAGIVGVMLVLAEMMYDKKVSKHLDLFLVLISLVFLSLSAVLGDWWLLAFWFALAALLTPCGIVWMLQLQDGDRADFLATSVVWYLVVIATLSVLTYVAFFMF